MPDETNNDAQKQNEVVVSLGSSQSPRPTPPVIPSSQVPGNDNNPKVVISDNPPSASPQSIPAPPVANTQPQQNLGQPQDDVYGPETIPTGLYRADEPAQSSANPGDAIVWEAPEFVDRHRDSTWYGAMVLGAMVVSIIIYLLNRDLFLSGAVLLGLIGLAVVNGRRPRIQQYEITTSGIRVGKTFYDFSNFRSFAIDQTANGTNLILSPMKRFMPAITIFIPNEYSDSVVDLLSGFMPMEQHKADLVDFISSKLHL